VAGFAGGYALDDADGVGMGMVAATSVPRSAGL
jgi:hypothetical protein